MKKLLIITYYWPPSGGSGVQRWTKFAKYLPNHGWQPVVITPQTVDTSVQDHSLLADIDQDIEVHHVPLNDPSTWIGNSTSKGTGDQSQARLEQKSMKMYMAKWLRVNCFIPDSRIVWKTNVMRYLKQHDLLRDIDCIVSTGPPHSMHMIGKAVATAYALPWIADFRDPLHRAFNLKDFPLTSWARRIYIRQERSILARADKVIATSPKMPDLLVPFDLHKFITITNGYDAANFSASAPARFQPFVLLHAGLIYPNRTPHLLMHLLEQLLNDKPDMMQNFEWRLAGSVSATFLQELEQLPHLKARTTVLGYLSHEEILAEYLNASMLLVLMINDEEVAPSAIPGKLFECIAAERPILSIGPRTTAYLDFFEGSDHFFHATFEQAEGLETYMTRYLTGPSEIEIDRKAFKRFERQALTERLVDILDELTHTS